MLNVMRKNAGSWLIKIILGLIIVVFVLWGVGSFRDQGGGRVATVNGESITFEEYRGAYDRLLEQVRARFGASLDENLLKMMNLQQQALNQLIDQKVMLAAAREMNLSVSEQELVDSIQRIGAFQSNGAFDRQRYLGVLTRLRMTPEVFEVYQRESLLIDKLRSIVVSGVKVSEPEVWEWYRWAKASVSLDYLVFDPAAYAGLTVQDAELQQYYEKNKSAYQTEPQARARYVRFRTVDYASRVNVSDEEVERYYQSHTDEFKSEKRVEARHILFKVDPNASPEVVEAARQEAATIMQRARDGEDFTELARRYSQGPSASNGGYLGAFGKGEMVAPFSNAAFSMKPGDISEPVRTQFGWHVIKVENVTEAATQSIAAAASGIREKLAREIAASMAFDEATAMLNAALSSQDLARAAGDAGADLRETGWFTPQGPVEIVQNPVAFAEATFGLEKDEISDVIDLGDGYTVLQVLEKKEPRIPELANVREAVTEDLLEEKRRDAAQADCKKALAEIHAGKTMEAAALERGKTIAHTGFFKRGEMVPDIGYEKAIIDAAFLLSPEHPLPQTPLEAEDGFYLIRFRQRQDPLRQDFEKERADTTRELLNRKRMQLFDEWLTERKGQSKIEIKEKFDN